MEFHETVRKPPKNYVFQDVFMEFHELFQNGYKTMWSESSSWNSMNPVPN
jgi:hypothetical protein